MHMRWSSTSCTAEVQDNAVQGTAARMASLAAACGAMLMALFALLERLSEMECMVRVLQLVSVLVEVLGDQIVPHLGIITRSLPQVRGSSPPCSLPDIGRPLIPRRVEAATLMI